MSEYKTPVACRTELRAVRDLQSLIPDDIAIYDLMKLHAQKLLNRIDDLVENGPEKPTGADRYFKDMKYLDAITTRDIGREEMLLIQSVMDDGNPTPDQLDNLKNRATAVQNRINSFDKELMPEKFVDELTDLLFDIVDPYIGACPEETKKTISARKPGWKDRDIQAGMRQLAARRDVLLTEIRGKHHEMDRIFLPQDIEKGDVLNRPEQEVIDGLKHVHSQQEKSVQLNGVVIIPKVSYFASKHTAVKNPEIVTLLKKLHVKKWIGLLGVKSGEAIVYLPTVNQPEMTATN